MPTIAPTIALIDSIAHPVAWDYYGLFPIDPVQPEFQQMEVETRYHVNDMTWQSLLSAIQAHASPGGSVLIVAHGTSHGISIPLYAGGPVLHADAMYEMASSFVYTPEQAARRANIQDVNIVRQFRVQLGNVAAMRLRRIELRACNVGRRPNIVESIRSLFNADYFGCPDIRDSFFGMRPTQVRPAGMSLQQWQQAHPNTTAPMSWSDWERIYPDHRHEFTTAQGRVSLFYREIPGRRIECELAAERSEAVHAWVNRKIPRGRWQGGLLPLHAFFGRPPIFPGDARYRAHLRYAARPRP